MEEKQLNKNPSEVSPKLSEEQIQDLVVQAFQAREYAYCPYSDFAVGAALLAEDGQIYQGCNIENAAYSPSNCAERTAFFKAVSQGERNFSAIAIVGGQKQLKRGETQYCAPCGVCRQVMLEFCGEDFLIILAEDTDRYQVCRLRELTPFGFTPEKLLRRF